MFFIFFMSWRFRKNLRLYFNFFDEKLWEPSFVVLIIGFVIFIVWYIWSSSFGNTYSNVLQYNNKKIIKNIIEIWWKRYELILKEI